MGRTQVFLLLLAASSISAAAQTATTTSTQSAPATNVTIVTPSGNAPVTSGSLPLPAPPETALPGSGTPVGTLPNVDVNNAAQGGSGAATQPGAVVVGNQAIVNAPPQVATPSATPMNVPGPATGPEATPGTESVPSASQATEPGTPVVRRVYVGAASVQAPAQPKSLGELSKQIRGNKPLAKRTFDNSDIMALSQKAPNGLRPQSEDLPQGDQPATTPQQKGKKPSAARPPQPLANNGALDQKDLAAVEAAVKKNKDKQNVEQPK